MLELFEAIMRHYKDSPLASKVTGLFTLPAPQGTVAPYVTFYQVCGHAGGRDKQPLRGMHYPVLSMEYLAFAEGVLGVIWVSA